MEGQQTAPTEEKSPTAPPDDTIQAHPENRPDEPVWLIFLILLFMFGNPLFDTCSFLMQLRLYERVGIVRVFPDIFSFYTGYGWFIVIFSSLVSIFFHAAEIGKAEALFPDIVNHPAFTQYKHFSWAILLICCIVSIIAGYRLWKYPVRKSVNSAIIALWFIALFPAIAMIVYTWATTGNVWYALAGIAGERWQPLIGAIIWHIYLRRSKRVKNTYR